MREKERKRERERERERERKESGMQFVLFCLKNPTFLGSGYDVGEKSCKMGRFSVYLSVYPYIPPFWASQPGQPGPTRLAEPQAWQAGPKALLDCPEGGMDRRMNNILLTKGIFMKCKRAIRRTQQVIESLICN